MSYYTPAGLVRKNGKPAQFKDIDKGATFELNGNLWSKRTSRTATGVWPAILPQWSYIRNNEKVHIE